MRYIRSITLLWDTNITSHLNITDYKVAIFQGENHSKTTLFLLLVLSSSWNLFGLDFRGFVSGITFTEPCGGSLRAYLYAHVYFLLGGELPLLTVRRPVIKSLLCHSLYQIIIIISLFNQVVIRTTVKLSSSRLD